MKLSSLTAEAEAFLREEKADGLSFRKLVPTGPYFDLISARLNRTLDVADIMPRFIGYDRTAPEGDRTTCDLCIADEVLNRAHQNHPQDEKLQWLLKAWIDIDDAIENHASSRKTLKEIAQMKNDLDRALAAWPTAELQRIQDLFLAVRKEIGTVPGAQFAPRYVSRIFMREREDADRIGEVQEKNGQPIRVGSFVAVQVSPRTCFQRVVFALGLQPGYHVLAGCGNADDRGSHLYALRNIRLKLKDDADRRSGHAIQRWQLLYAQTHDQALKIKELNTEQLPAKGAQEPETASVLWSQTSGATKGVKRQSLWVTGEPLEKLLSLTPDKSSHNTNRGLALRCSPFTHQWEIIMVLERGDNPDKKSGKPPAFGVPGGTVDDKETIGQALRREFQNEAGTREVEKVLAYIAEQRKKNRKDPSLENIIDRWFLVKPDQEAGHSRNIIETREIKKVLWVPLIELPRFKFQDTRPGKAIWDVRRVDEEKRMFFNHGDALFQILPTLTPHIPSFVLPDNWDELGENLRKFEERDRS